VAFLLEGITWATTVKNRPTSAMTIGSWPTSLTNRSILNHIGDVGISAIIFDSNCMSNGRFRKIRIENDRRFRNHQNEEQNQVDQYSIWKIKGERIVKKWEMEELKEDLLEKEVSQECSVDEQNLRLKKNEES
jgi:hypothetical protein